MEGRSVFLEGGVGLYRKTWLYIRPYIVVSTMASKYPAKSGGGKSRRSAKQDELENKDPEDMTTEELQSWNIQMAFDLGFIIKPGKKQPLKEEIFWGFWKILSFGISDCSSISRLHDLKRSYSTAGVNFCCWA